MVLDMAKDDTQMKIRLPMNLKERLLLRAQKFGNSMNAEIIGLLEEALSKYPYSEPKAGLTEPSTHSSDEDLEYEMEQLHARMDVIDQDIYEFSDRISHMKGEDSSSAYLRQMLIRKMSEMDEEREKLWERVKLIKQILRKKRKAKSVESTSGES